MQWKIFVAGVFDLLLLLLYRYLVIQIAHTVEHCHGPSTAHIYVLLLYYIAGHNYIKLLCPAPLAAAILKDRLRYLIMKCICCKIMATNEFP